jgi:hypothetical protein
MNFVPSRDVGDQIVRVVADQELLDPAHRIRGIDVAVPRGDDRAIAREPERFGQGRLPRSQGEDRQDSDQEDRRGRQHQPSEAGHGDERSDGRFHGEPPFGARPPRSLPGRDRLLQHLRQVVGHPARAVLAEPRGEVASETIVDHDGRPSARSGWAAASASSAVRIRAMA